MLKIEISINDPILAAIFGGVLGGFSTGFYLNLGGCVGGLDILGIVIKKRYEIPIGIVFNFVSSFSAILLFIKYFLYFSYPYPSP